MDLRVHEVSKQFGGLKALNNVSLEIKSGERRGVIGPNGAGKTTLFRIISGEMRASSGAIWLQDRRVDGIAPERLASLGVSRTFQRSHLFLEQSALVNVALARAAAKGRASGFWNPLESDDRTWEALEQVGLADKAHVTAGALSHGEQRQLEIAMALVQDPKVLLLDEPLAGLSGAERERAGELLRALPRNLTVLVIEHDLSFVQGFADRITVLHYGEVLAEGTPEEIRSNPKVQEVYVGRGEDLEWGGAEGTGPELLRIQGLAAGYGATRVLSGVDIQIRQGEVVALLGRNGMGKTTLMHTLMGFVRLFEGDITFGGRSIGRLPAQERARLGLALVPQGRRMLDGVRVEEELSLAASGGGRWTEEAIYQLFPQLVDRRQFYSTSLSGGEQQMVAIGRALLRNPKLLLMDEPTEGLSPLLVEHVRKTIQTLKEEGETILLAEQNMDVALSVADRVYILEHGQVVFSGLPKDLAANRAVMKERLGVG